MTVPTIPELADQIRAGLDADELWAREASRNQGHPIIETGEHWHWQCTEHDHEIEPNPGVKEFIEPDWCECFRVSLRSVEMYPRPYGDGTLPNFALPMCEEVPSAVGGHIARHDPARVLAEVTAKRALLDFALGWEHTFGWFETCYGDPCLCDRDEKVRTVLALLAAPYQTGV